MSVVAKPESVKHPYITRKEGVCGGEPIIGGTRISVRCIVEYIQYVGYTPEEIVRHLPHLNLAQVYDALSYYYDHKDEIDEAVRANSEEELMKRYPPGRFRA
ncbi:MAG: DUF433 domain-containing protein [Candidatus Latescibacterota bacterium]|nr:MAG: DUF433 domain-containing protein [Candidatus Latescibacterota bacterium]RKY70040.1 MAG: DUF433 domain-containing protein [Candidatus Latescibacterota bacterium]